MNVRRVLVLTITALVATGAGYALLGLRAPKPLATAQTTPRTPTSAPTIIAVGPDGTLYAIRAPAGTISGGAAPRYGEREESRGFYDDNE